MIKSSSHDYLIVLGILNIFCRLLPYQINFNDFFFVENMQISILVPETASKEAVLSWSIFMAIKAALL